jgi:hypothetical protein
MKKIMSFYFLYLSINDSQRIFVEVGNNFCNFFGYNTNALLDFSHIFIN